MKNGTRMKAPKGAVSCTHEGARYEVDKKGHVEVPLHVAAELRAHGFAHIGDDDLTDEERQAMADERAEATKQGNKKK